MEVLINLKKLGHNILTLQTYCRDAGLQVVWITKGCHSYPPVIKLLADTGAEIIGDAYLMNFRKNLETFSGERMMISFPSQKQTDQAVASTDINLISCPDHARALSKAAEYIGKKQGVMLMVDVGNLREGVMPDQVLPVVEKILSYPGIELNGVGTSAGCFAGYRIGEKDLADLVRIAREIEDCTRLKLPVVSIGSGTMVVDLIFDGKIPHGINQVRIGAGFLVGEKPPLKEAIPDLFQDAFIIRAEILELSEKPSLPATMTGHDAFGRKIVFEDIGERKKAILNIGAVDVDAYDLSPMTSGVKIIGASSNYTVCDVTHCDTLLKVGKHLDFRMGYSAMSTAMSSKYTQKTVVN